MASLNLAKLLHNRSDAKKQREEAVLLFKQEIQTRLCSLKRNVAKEERKIFTEQLKLSGVAVEDFVRLAQEVGNDSRAFLRWEKRNSANREAETLAEVIPKTSFSKILCIIRETYAQDIASYIPYDAAAKIVIDEVLLHS
jgi:hypothetical protein